MRFFIKSYGCQMNSHDSQRISSILSVAGHEVAPSLNEANLVILNTCSIRDKADEKVFSDLGRLKFLKCKAIDDFLIIVAGCMAQLRSRDIIKRAPYVNAIIGPQNIHQLADCIDDLLKNKAIDAIVATSMDVAGKFQAMSSASPKAADGVSAFLTIQEGCDNFCTYCIVPFTRGRQISRSLTDIRDEARRLTFAGVKEITLVGQNVNAYNGDEGNNEKCDFSHLLFELSKTEGLKRLRYTTSHPKYINSNIALAHREIEILAPHLHLPVQSGSNDILKQMNRRYTRDEYLRAIDLLRESRQDMAFSSDFIVGFPGETDRDFEQTLELVREVRYTQAYSFKYSPRPGTIAAKMENQVPEEVKSERLQILQELLDDQQTQFNSGFVHRRLSVLFTKNGHHENQLTGRSEYSQAVSIYDKTISIGDIVDVQIIEVATHSLIGML
jgi:tRNA-2-methylthio-N6-dimethylallyladenosine synthase